MIVHNTKRITGVGVQAIPVDKRVDCICKIFGVVPEDFAVVPCADGEKHFDAFIPSERKEWD